MREETSKRLRKSTVPIDTAKVSSSLAEPLVIFDVFAHLK